MKKITFFILLFCLLAACNHQEAGDDQNLTTPVPAIHLKDVETAIMVHSMSLKEADLPSDNVFLKTLHGVSPKVYFLDSSTLSIYIFPTKEDRVQGMKDFEHKTATASLVAHQVYPVENLLVFYAEGSKEMNDKLNAIFASLAKEQELYSFNEKDGVKLLASEKTLPDDIHEFYFQREFPPHHEYFIYKADDQKTYEEASDLFSSQQPLHPLPQVNFEENNVLFVGVRESGSCPYELEWVENKSDLSAIAFKLTVTSTSNECTSDANPRTFVVQISHELSSHHEHVLIIEGNTKTVVPIYDMHE